MSTNQLQERRGDSRWERHQALPLGPRLVVLVG